MNIKTLIAAGALAAITLAGQAQASLVDFEGSAGGSCVQSQINSGGLSFNTGFFQCLRNTATGTQGSDNGTDFLINGYSNLTVTATDGNPFDLMGLDLGISYYNSSASDQVTLTAFLHGGGSVAQILNIGQSFASYGFSLTGLDSFTLSTPAVAGGYIAVDNINFSQGGSTVPEPASIALLGVGLLGLVAARKRSKN